MDFHAEAVIADEFMRFLMNGSLYQGSKPVMWSPVEKTALAEAEVEYHDHTSHTIWVRFKVPPSNYMAPFVHPEQPGSPTPQRVLNQSNLAGVSIVIWTTTPWTIPQNRAVSYNPNISYGLYRVDAVAENGPYIVIAPGIALAHGRPSEAVLEVGLSLVTLAQPVDFGNEANDPVRLVIGLCATDHNTHIDIMAELATFLGDSVSVNTVLNAVDSDHIRSLF